MDQNDFEILNREPRRMSVVENRPFPPLRIHRRKLGRFVSLSTLFHLAAIAVVLFVTPTLFVDTPKHEVIEFEVTGNTPAAAPAAPAPQKIAEPALPAVTAPAPVVKAAPVAKAAAPVVAKAPVVKSAPVPAKAVAENLDDIKAPDLDAPKSVSEEKLDEKDLSEDFDKVDAENAAKVAAAQKEIDDDGNMAVAEHEAALKKAAQEAKAEAAAMEKASRTRHAQEQAKIAKAAAAEKAAADQAAAEKAAAAQQAAQIAAAKEAEQIAAQQAAARESAAREAAAKEAALRKAEATGTGGSGANPVANGTAPTGQQSVGAGEGMRSMSDLRQMPGNRFPQYSQEERLQREEGTIIFHAYVNKDGSLSQFQLIQTTGHRSLDAKTLAALKSWRFYPGQEGWVEMPFEWDLKGDALEAGGQLGQRQARRQPVDNHE